MALRLAIVICLAMMLLHTMDARSSGPPVDEDWIRDVLCIDMTPLHGGSGQTSDPPYTISTSAMCYTPGQAVDVTLHGNDDAQYRGFFLQARKPNINTMSHGTFDVSATSTMKTLDCFQQKNNAVGHTSSITKTSETVKWTPPSDLSGDVEFVATVVKSWSEYWVAAVKKTIQLCSSMTTSSAGNETMVSMGNETMANMTDGTTMTMTTI